MSEKTDFSSLLLPINKNYLTGNDLRKDPEHMHLYYHAKDLRFKARNKERLYLQNETEDSGKEEWQELLLLSKNILSTYSKDLEICAWLVEAELRKNGLDGLINSLNFMLELIKRYVLSLYPQDEDEYKTEVLESPIIQIVGGLFGEELPGSLVSPLMMLSITSEETSKSVLFWQYKRLLDVSRIKDFAEREKKYNELSLSLDDAILAAKESGYLYYENLSTKINQLKNISNALFIEISGISKHVICNMQHFDLVLEDFLLHVSFLQNEIQKEVHFKNDEKKSNHDAVVLETNLHYNQDNLDILKERKACIVKLKEIASYFEIYEPHSPLSSVLKRAIIWSTLSFEDLMQELIVEPSAKQYFFNLTGVSL